MKPKNLKRSQIDFLLQEIENTHAEIVFSFSENELKRLGIERFYKIGNLDKKLQKIAEIGQNWDKENNPIGRVQIRPSGGGKIELVPPKLKVVQKIAKSVFFFKKLKTGRKIVFRSEN